MFSCKNFTFAFCICSTLQLFTIHFKVQMSIEVYFNTGKDNNKTHVIYNVIPVDLILQTSYSFAFPSFIWGTYLASTKCVDCDWCIENPVVFATKQLTFNDLSYCIENKFMLFITLRISSKVRLHLIIFSGNGQSFVHFDLLPQMNFNN